MADETKHLVLEVGTGTPNRNREKEKQKKVITESEEWATISQHLDIDSQKDALRQLSVPEPERTKCLDSLIRMMKTKLSGYRSQDNTKGFYDETQFVGFDEVVAALLAADMKCFYCKGHVQLMYEYVREPRQWTLDRIDNTVGHNRGNVEIACLECNLRRKTMYHERYVYTKQAVIRKV
jgi:hypothetical protein